MKIVALCLLALNLYLPYSQAQAASAERLAVMRIDSRELSALERGIQIGTQAKALFPNIEQRYDKHLAQLFKRNEYQRLVRNRLPKYLAALEQPYQDEIKGTASTWSLAASSYPGDGQLSLAEYQVLNLLADIMHPPNGIAYSAFGKISPQDGTLNGRNVDWISSPELRSLQIILVEQQEQRSIVMLGFAGLHSTSTGFNDKGLFITLSNAEPYSPYAQYLPESSTRQRQLRSFDVRTTLSKHGSLHTATQFLKNRHYTGSHSILLSDRKHSHVLEYNPNERQARLRRWNSPLRAGKDWDNPQQLAMVNCLVLAGIPNTCHDAKDNVRWRHIDRLANFDAKQPISSADMVLILSDQSNRHYELLNQHTLQSFYYIAARQELYLYTQPIEGGHPSNPKYHAYLQLLPTATNSSNTPLQPHWWLWAVIIFITALVAWYLYRHKMETPL